MGKARNSIENPGVIWMLNYVYITPFFQTDFICLGGWFLFILLECLFLKVFGQYLVKFKSD